MAGSPSGNNLTPAGPCRYDNSLGIIITALLFISSLVIIKLLLLFNFLFALLDGNEVSLCYFNYPMSFSLKNLGLLTKKFINLIKQAEDGILDLNQAADTLEVNIFSSGLNIPCCVV